MEFSNNLRCVVFSYCTDITSAVLNATHVDEELFSSIRRIFESSKARKIKLKFDEMILEINLHENEQ